MRLIQFVINIWLAGTTGVIGMLIELSDPPLQMPFRPHIGWILIAAALSIIIMSSYLAAEWPPGDIRRRR